MEQERMARARARLEALDARKAGAGLPAAATIGSVDGAAAGAPTAAPSGMPAAGVASAPSHVTVELPKTGANRDRPVTVLVAPRRTLAAADATKAAAADAAAPAPWAGLPAAAASVAAASPASSVGGDSAHTSGSLAGARSVSPRYGRRPQCATFFSSAARSRLPSSAPPPPFSPVAENGALTRLLVFGGCA